MSKLSNLPYSMSVGGGMKFEEVEEDDDISTFPNEYIATLRKQKINADNLVKEDDNQSNSLSKSIDPNRSSITREGKVLTVWQERQQEWERIRRKIHSKVYHDNPMKNLVMESIDNYRPKVEEYDTILAAIPLKERFWSDSWQSTLRDGVGTRKVPIGNIYSGLECEVDKPLLPPIMIRKPTSTIQMKTTGIGTSCQDQGQGQFTLFDPKTTKNLEQRKQKLSKDILKIRPHILTNENIESMAICSTDLFEWAIDSSQDYFNQQRSLLELQSSTNPSEKNDHITNKYEDNIDGDGNITDNIDRKVNDQSSLSFCCLEYLSPKKIIFQCRRGKTVMKTVTCINSSEVTIGYHWERKSYVPSSNSKLETSLNQTDNLPREFQIRNQRHYFICLKIEGKILPGDRIDTPFVFNTVDTAGIFIEEWILVCTPPAKIIFHNHENRNQSVSSITNANSNLTSSSIKNCDNGESENKSLDLCITLHGHCMDMDESGYARKNINRSVVNDTMKTYATEIIDQCISRIRTPVTVTQLHEREKKIFLQTNKSMIDKLLAVESKIENLNQYLSIERIRQMEKKCLDVIAYRMNMMKRYLFLQHKMSLEDCDIGDIIGIESNDWPLFDDNDQFILSTIKNTHTDPDVLTNIQSKLFPETTIEIFDQITDSDIIPTWDYNMIKAVEELTNNSLSYAQKIPKIEQILTQRIKAYERQQRSSVKLEAKRLKNEAKALKAQQREENSDDDENNQEDEDEENDGNDADDNDDDDDDDDGNNNQDDEPGEGNQNEIDTIDGKNLSMMNDLISVEKTIGPWELNIVKLRSECIGMIASLFYPELPVSQLERSTTSILHDKLSMFDQWKDAALNNSGMIAPPQKVSKGGDIVVTTEIIYDRLKSPFISSDGENDWKLVLSSSIVFDSKSNNKNGKKVVGLTPAPLSPVSSPTSLNKQNSKSKDKDKTILVASKDQVIVYYHNLYNSIQETLYSVVDSMFEQIDNVMYCNSMKRIQTIGYSSNLFFHHAIYRPQDIVPSDVMDKTKSSTGRSDSVLSSSFPSSSFSSSSSRKGKIVFLNFPGEWYTKSKARLLNSSFDIASIEQKKSLKIIQNIIMSGAKSVIILYESKPTSYDISFKTESFLKSAKPIFDKYFNELNSISLNSSHDGSKIIYEVIYCNTIAELKYKLQLYGSSEQNNDIGIGGNQSIAITSESSHSGCSINPATNPTATATGMDKKSKRKKITVPVVVPIFVLEDIRLQNVIPAFSEHKPIEPSDEDCPIFIAQEENGLYEKQKHMKSGPYKVSCTVPVALNDSSHHQLSSVSIDCYSSPYYAIKEIYDIAENISLSSMSGCEVVGYELGPRLGCLWIDSTLDVLLPIIPEISPENEYLTEEIHRTNGTILSSYLNHNSFFSPHLRLSSEVIREIMVWFGVLFSLPNSIQYFTPNLTIESSNTDSNDKSIANHMQRLFPRITTSSPRKVNGLAIIGGELRLDKLVSMYQLVDLVDTIYIAGEVVVPFIAYHYSYIFPKYMELISKYSQLCIQLITKARMRGTKLIFPTDVNIADEAINKMKMFTIKSPRANDTIVACDEGLDYDGDTLVYKLNEIKDNVIHGYVYDIGKESTECLKKLVLASDMIVSWGPVGACEFTCFQHGQRALASCASQVFYADRSNPLITDKNRPSQTMVIGEMSVEWYCRILDSDGENSGDLVGNGALAYTLRQSRIFSGFLGLSQSKYVLDMSMKRNSFDGVNEWVFNAPTLDSEEEDHD